MKLIKLTKKQIKGGAIKYKGTWKVEVNACFQVQGISCVMIRAPKEENKQKHKNKAKKE